ncbi:MAG TPA: c-type cytochrome biogenesis protein CcmI [Candidatus Cybelea sp.]|nr:c-type cytochrome biogenesis protein CcmI [Candidatus Cybelea sp.]
MILLWIVLGIMTLAAALVLAWPLFDARRFKNDSSFALAVYRDQLAEINRDAARGILDETQAKAAQIEIERRILALDDAPKFQPAKAPTPVLIVAMAVVLPLLAFGLYLRLGSPGLPGEPGPGPEAMQAASPELQALIDAANRSPTDPAAWRALGEGLLAAHRTSEGANAFARAIGLGDRDPKLQSRYGSALVLASGGEVDDKAKAAFTTALAADPTDPIARFFMGLSKAQSGDRAAALTDWLALERDLPPDTPWRGDLTNNIDQLARELGKDPASLPGRAKAVENPPPPAGNASPSAADLAAAANMTDSERQTFIEGMVQKLADQLKASPDDIDGWSRLAKAYGVLGKHDEARAAWAKAAALAPSRLDVQLDYANALIEGSSDLAKALPPDFAATVTRIRTLAPDNPLGLYYGGLVARANGDKAGAKAMWAKVLALIPVGSPQRDSLQREIDSLSQ